LNSAACIASVAIISLYKHPKHPKGDKKTFLATSPEEEKIYIQVCSGLGTGDVRQREFRPLAELLSLRNKAAFLVLTLTTADVSICQKEAPPRLTVRPAWEWLPGNAVTG
jgi:hypothetical protein